MVSRSHKPKPKKQIASSTRLAADIAPLARRHVRFQEEAKALGVFTNERELLTCERCGVREDVDANGRLFAYFGEDPESDVGLPFLKTETPHVFLCPSCGAEVVEPEEAP